MLIGKLDAPIFVPPTYEILTHTGASPSAFTFKAEIVVIAPISIGTLFEPNVFPLVSWILIFKH